ncbi:cupin domain-containing protein [Ilumatobacter sp.]|uniref:cupin domain-containing protein n=1 Tax=Ilumatobacter sp. TaxID=1967498 RepID=UPI003C5006AE
MYQRPLHTRVQGSVDRFADSETLWHTLLRGGTRAPAFRLVRAGSTVHRSGVTRRAGIGNRSLDDVVDPNRVVDRYRSGDTVVLQGLHHTDPALAELANNLALALDQPIQINAYLSPPGERGLDVHFDYHDVFVVQLAGAKRWRIWEPLERTRNPVKGRHTIAGPSLDELGDPLLDLTLRAGDVLYLPRGYPHVAESLDELSDHLTIGLVAVTWHRVVRTAVDAEVAAGRMSAPLPVGLLDPSADVAGDVDTSLGLDALREQLSPDVLRHWLAREIWRRQPATRLRPRCRLELGSAALGFAPGPLLWLTSVGDRVVLGLGDRLLDLPIEAYDFLAGMLESDATFRPDELEGLDEASRDVVLRRLLNEGVIVHAD